MMSTGKVRSILKMVWSVLRPQWVGTLIVMALIPVGSLLALVHPFLLKRIVDNHLKIGSVDGLDALAEIGRASCRKECRSRWSPYH